MPEKTLAASTFVGGRFYPAGAPMFKPSATVRAPVPLVAARRQNAEARKQAEAVAKAEAMTLRVQEIETEQKEIAESLEALKTSRADLVKGRDADGVKAADKKKMDKEIDELDEAIVALEASVGELTEELEKLRAALVV